MNIAVLVSGNGTNLQALVDAEAHGELAGGKIVIVISDNPEAFALQRAKKAKIPAEVIEGKCFDSRETYDKCIVDKLKQKNIDLVVLAGFMRILSESFVNAYKDKIINIHPALLPDFKGAHAIRDAYEAKVKVTGVTVHFVTKDLDAGPIILKEEVPVEENDELDELEERIHKVEHKLYPEAVKLFAEGKLLIEDGKVKIK